MKRSPMFSARGAAAAISASVLTFGLAACGGDDSGSGEAGDLAGDIAGAGSSAQGAAMQAWIAGFTEVAPDVTVTYDPVGSGGGREQFTAGGVSFAGSDAYLEEEEIAAAEEACGGDYIEFPAYISPIAIAYNLPGIDTLNLSPSVIAQIFDTKITSWDDPAIAELNPDVDLPSTPITPVHRSDESGTTENFVDYLAKAAPEDWPYEVDGNWPASGGEAANQTQGVAAALTGGEGAIGYIDASQAGDLGVAAVQVGDDFVAYSPEAAAAAVDAAEVVEGRGENSYAIDLPRDTTEAGVYPVVLVSYQLACVSYEDQATADNVKAFLEYVISPEGQDIAAQNAGSAPISDSLRETAQGLVDQIIAG
ncbi:MAG: phosphate ABC transporter substrate-binding protein PstS [Nocardioides sp.]